MNKHIVTLASRALLALVLSVGLALAEETPQLLKLKHTVLSPASEQVMLQLNGSYSPKVFTLKDETPRVIFDFADMTHSREVKSITTGGSIVKRVRVGMHGDDSPKTRIVFDVATLKGVTYTQNFDEQTSTLTVRFTRPEKAVESKKVAAKEQQEKPPVTTSDTPEGTANDTAASGQASPESAPAKDAETAPATAVEPQAAAPPAAADQSPEPKVDQEQQTASPPQPSAPAPEALAVIAPAVPPAPVAPAPADKTVAPPVTTAEQQAAPPSQSPPVQPPAQPEPSKATEQAKAQPEEKKPAQETAPATAVEGTLQENKAGSAAPKEPPPPATATPPQATATTETAKAESARTTETAKVATPAKTEEGPQLESVKFDPSSPKGEMVLFKLNGFHPPAVHGVEEGIPRVVCDFNNTKLISSGSKVIKADGKFVKAIRTSKTKKPERVRVVIDLEPNRNYDLQQVFFKEDNLFVIIVNTVKK